MNIWPGSLVTCTIVSIDHYLHLLFTFHGAFDECTYTLVEYDIEDKVTYANRRPIYVISKSEVRFEFQTRKSNELGNDP